MRRASSGSSTGRRPRRPASRRRSRTGSSVAVGESETIRTGFAASVTLPFASVTVTGSPRDAACGREAGAATSARASAPSAFLVTMKNLRVVAEEVGSAAVRREPPFLRGLTFVRRKAGDLARPPVCREASQLRDSAGFAPASLRLHRPGICARRGEVSAYCDRGARRDPHDRQRSRLRRRRRTRTRAWLAQRLESLGVRIVLTASVPDEIDAIAEFIRRERDRVDHLVVTGGLGGTPDDITREALAAAFEVAQVEVPDLAADLRARFPRHPGLRRALGAAPGRQPPADEPARRRAGLRDRERLGAARPAVRDGGDVRPLRRRAARRAADRRRGAAPTARARATSSTCSPGATVRWPQVRIGSYPRFLPDGPEVEIVLKSANPKTLAEAVAWLEPALEEATAAAG